MSEEVIVRLGAPTLAGIKTGSLFTCAYTSRKSVEESLRRLNRCFAPKGLCLLPLRYSEGFNPHVRLSFGMPLSVGAESITEYMDVQLTREVDPQWAKSQLNAQLPQELSVLSAAAAVHRFSEIAFACYALELRCAATTQADAEKINALWNNPLIVEKRTKKGIVPTDISPMIRKAQVHAAETGLYAEVLLSASSASYLNPDYLLRAAAAALGIAYDDPEALTPVILRTGVYLSDTVTPFC